MTLAGSVPVRCEFGVRVRCEFGASSVRVRCEVRCEFGESAVFKSESEVTLFGYEFWVRTWAPNWATISGRAVRGAVRYAVRSIVLPHFLSLLLSSSFQVKKSSQNKQYVMPHMYALLTNHKHHKPQT